MRLTPQAAHGPALRARATGTPRARCATSTALTAGVSRRAAIQRQLLPVMLGWFADGADPDAGLLAFRRVSDGLGTTHWYLKMLRDSGAAAERLAHVLSAGQLVAELLERGPEAVAMLGDDAELAPRDARHAAGVGPPLGRPSRRPGRRGGWRPGRCAGARSSGPRSPTWSGRSTWPRWAAR